VKDFFKHLKGDAFGGITAGIVALPLALAFGVSSGLGPSAGLYGAIIIGFFAALFGGTPTQISGPTAPMTAVSMVVIAGILASNDGDIATALPAILTASHIVPWRDCVGEKAGLRLNGANGILLCSNIDRLFDRYLLSFSQTGGAARIRFSKILPSDLLVQLGLTSDLELIPNGMVQADKELFFECLSKHHATFLEKESER